MFPGTDILVINAAVPGWVSDDSVKSLEARVLPLSPDIVVVMDGRNDAWPQAFANYRDDYSHYLTRDPIAIAEVQSAQRSLFRRSHLAMLMAHRMPSPFGYQAERFFPVYARVHWENGPAAEQVVAFAEEESRFASYAVNQARIVALTREKGAIPVLATIVFDPARYESGLLPGTPEAIAAATKMVLHNIETTRRVAREQSALLFDGFAISTPDLLFDDCHPNERGEEVFGRALAEHIAPQLRERIGR
jgi:lysophospholipase L1-like esterase